MNGSVPVAKLTPEEFLVQEREAAYRSEYFDGVVYAMAGGSPAHARILTNLTVSVGSQLAGRKCQSIASEPKVWIPGTKSICYPDLVAVCEDPKYFNGDALENPVLVIEVLSASTERMDRTKKFDDYRSIATFVQYVLVWQGDPRVEVLTKSPDGFWVFSLYSDLSEIVSLSAIGVDVPISAVYDRIAFPAASVE